MLDELESQIEKLRQELEKKYVTIPQNKKQILKLSQELDQFLLQYQRKKL